MGKEKVADSKANIIQMLELANKDFRLAIIKMFKVRVNTLEIN